jgi:hypothetical protein
MEKMEESLSLESMETAVEMTVMRRSHILAAMMMMESMVNNQAARDHHFLAKAVMKTMMAAVAMTEGRIKEETAEQV